MLDMNVRLSVCLSVYLHDYCYMMCVVNLTMHRRRGRSLFGLLGCMGSRKAGRGYYYYICSHYFQSCRILLYVVDFSSSSC